LGVVGLRGAIGDTELIVGSRDEIERIDDVEGNLRPVIVVEWQEHQVPRLERKRRRGGEVVHIAEIEENSGCFTRHQVLEDTLGWRPHRGVEGVTEPFEALALGRCDARRRLDRTDGIRNEMNGESIAVARDILKVGEASVGLERKCLNVWIAVDVDEEGIPGGDGGVSVLDELSDLIHFFELTNVVNTGIELIGVRGYHEIARKTGFSSTSEGRNNFADVSNNVC